MQSSEGVRQLLQVFTAQRDAAQGAVRGEARRGDRRGCGPTQRQLLQAHQPADGVRQGGRTRELSPRVCIPFALGLCVQRQGGECSEAGHLPQQMEVVLLKVAP